MKKIVLTLFKHAITGRWTIADTATFAAITAVPVGLVTFVGRALL